MPGTTRHPQPEKLEWIMDIQQINSIATAASAQAPPRPAPARTAAPEAIQLLPKQPEQSSKEQVQQAVAEIQKAVEPMARNLQFSIDKETGKTVVTVVDSATNEVIRQIPGEEVLAIARAIDRMQGLLFRQKA
jgi:flagellar protein FlaG